MVQTVFVIASRVALIFWICVTLFIAVGSLVASPVPFVLVALGIAATPPIARMTRHRWWSLASLALLAALVPTALFASYGEAEGGTSGAVDALTTFGLLYLLAFGLAIVGYGMGRIVWAPTSARDATTHRA